MFAASSPSPFHTTLLYASPFSTTKHTGVLCFATDHGTDLGVHDAIHHDIPILTAALQHEFGKLSTPADIHVFEAHNACDEHSVANTDQLEKCKQNSSISSAQECTSLLSSEAVSELNSNGETQLQKVIILFSESLMTLSNRVDHTVGRSISGKSVDSFNQLFSKPLIIKSAAQSKSSLYHAWEGSALHIASHVHRLMNVGNACVALSCQYVVRAGPYGHPNGRLRKPQAAVLHMRNNSHTVFIHAIRRAFDQSKSKRFRYPAFRLSSKAVFDQKASKEHNANVLRETLERLVFLRIGGRFVRGMAKGPLMKSGVIVMDTGKYRVVEAFKDERKYLTERVLHKSSELVISSCRTSQCEAKVLLRSTRMTKTLAIYRAASTLRKRPGFRSVFIFQH